MPMAGTSGVSRDNFSPLTAQLVLQGAQLSLNEHLECPAVKQPVLQSGLEAFPPASESVWLAFQSSITDCPNELFHTARLKLKSP